MRGAQAADVTRQENLAKRSAARKQGGGKNRPQRVQLLHHRVQCAKPVQRVRHVVPMKTQHNAGHGGVLNVGQHRQVDWFRLKVDLHFRQSKRRQREQHRGIVPGLVK